MSQWGKWGKWGRWGEAGVAGGDTLYWVGTSDTAWANAANWSWSSGGSGGAGTPDRTLNVVIEAAPNACLSSVFDDECNALTIEAGGVFNNSAFQFNVYGDLTCNSAAVMTWREGWNLRGGNVFIAAAAVNISYISCIFKFYEDGTFTDEPQDFGAGLYAEEADITILDAGDIARIKIEPGNQLLVTGGLTIVLGVWNNLDWDGGILRGVADATWDLDNSGVGAMVVVDATIRNSHATNSIDASDNCVDEGDNVNWDFIGQDWPVVHNWEGDTVLDDVATLDAKDTHYETGAAGALLQLDDHLLWNPQDIGGPPNLTLGLENPGNVSAWGKILFAAGGGFTPQDNQEICIESVNIVNGTNNRHIMYIRSEDNQEGFRLEMYGNSFNYLRTMTGGVWDAAWKLGPYGLSRTPSGDRWWYWGVRYNFANNQVRCRVLPLSTGSGQTDTGWVLIGTVSGPSFDPTVELREVLCIAGGGTVAPCGQGQIYVSDFAVDGSSDGAIMTHNYVVPA